MERLTRGNKTGGPQTARPDGTGVQWTYNGLTAGGGKVRISPVLQLIMSQRSKDTGLNSNTDDSGYTRAIISPGVEIGMGDWNLYGDVEIPIYQYYRGNQLAAPEAFKLILSRNF